MVLTSDRPPPDIADLDERLISRLAGGLVVDIGARDYETRVAILRRKAEERGAKFEPGVLETVAGAESGNVRELMGALNRLVAFQAVNDRSINAETAKQLLGIGSEAAPGDRGKAAGRQGAPAGRGGGGDEFGDFLADVTVTVGKAVEAWRARVGEAVLRWEGEGYRTRRLEALLERDTPGAVDAVITTFTQDVERLKELEAEVAELDPQAAGQSVFRDPERLAEAEEVAAKVRDGAAPPPGPSAAFPLAAYAVGPSNEVAVGAARAVLKQPGKKYNPLVLVGKSGLGKTHLLNALGLELARGQRALVDYLADRPAESVRGMVGELQRVVGAAAAQDGRLTAGLAREVLEGQTPRDSRRTGGFRTSGIVVSSLGGIKSREKMVWDWSDVADRVIEEFR